MTNRLHYGITAKIFHWLIVALLVVQYPIGWLMPDIHRDMKPGDAMTLHILLWNSHPRADRFAVPLPGHPSCCAGKLASFLAASDLGGGTLAALRAGVCGHVDWLAVCFTSWLAGLV